MTRMLAACRRPVSAFSLTASDHAMRAIGRNAADTGDAIGAALT